MTISPNRIPVRVHRNGEYVENGILEYHKNGPVITLDDGEIVDYSNEVTFSIQSKFKTHGFIGFNPEDRIHLRPDVVLELGFSSERYSGLEMYPPSSDGWLQHVVSSGTKSIFTLQHIEGKSKFLLSVVEKDTHSLLYLSLINSYESSILSMKRDWTIHNDIIYSETTDSDIFDILQNESLSWVELSKLIEGVDITDISIKETMEETLTQIVPNAFPHNIRKQVMAFFGWLHTASISDEDPVDIASRFRSVGAFRTLVGIHFRCMLDDVAPPKYAHIMQQAERGQLEIPPRPKSEAVELDMWDLVRLKLYEVSPSWRGRAVRYALELQNEGKIVTELPVSRDAAKVSRDAWSDRYAMVNHTLYMRGFVNKESLGLRPVIYTGAAHRWPHKHLDFSVLLGYEKENPQYLQVMLMPQTALERVSRIMSKVRLIDWEMSSYNLSLYKESERKWGIKKGLLLKSLERKRSLRQLTNEFGKWKGDSYYKLTRDAARILDLISWGMYLSTLESSKYAKYYGLSASKIEEELTQMKEHGVFLLHYFPNPEKVKPLCVQAEGSSNTICSLSRAFLKYTPSCQIRITQQGKSCVITTRVPEGEYYDFAKSLDGAAKEIGVSLKVQPISAYAGYRNDLYSRLLKDDGTWDDNVSGLLNQVRLRTKDNNE